MSRQAMNKKKVHIPSESEGSDSEIAYESESSSSVEYVPNKKFIRPPTTKIAAKNKALESSNSEDDVPNIKTKRVPPKKIATKNKASESSSSIDDIPNKKFIHPPSKKIVAKNKASSSSNSEDDIPKIKRVPPKKKTVAKNKVSESSDSKDSESSNSIEDECSSSNDDILEESGCSDGGVPNKKINGSKCIHACVPGFRPNGDMCYHFVPINDNFTHTHYGDFKMMVMNANGYVNVDKICFGARKIFQDWLKKSETKELISGLEKILKPDEVVMMNMNDSAKTKGTYIHPYLIPSAVAHIAPLFAARVTKMMIKYLVEEKICNKFETMHSSIHELMDENNDLICENDDLKKRLGILPKNIKKQCRDSHTLFIVKFNDKLKNKTVKSVKTTYEYRAFICKITSFASKIDKIKDEHPNVDIVYKKNYPVDPFDIWEDVSDDLKGQKKIKGKMFSFNLINGYNENNLLKYIKKSESSDA